MVKTFNRWLIAVICTLLMVNLGTVYAWSFFQKPLSDAYFWSNSQVAWAFSLAICFLGLAAAAGGMLLPKTGPTILALLGGMLFGCGYLLAAQALRIHSLPLLYAGYGVIGGTGLGLSYVTPVATMARWFPDRKGFATGMVVMGFGFGALLMSKVLAPLLLARLGGDMVRVFAVMGMLFLLLIIPAAAFVRNPPAGWMPSGYILPMASAGSGPDEHGRGTRACLISREFALLWVIFFCNITAGIAIIGFQSPLFQDIWSKADPALGKEALARYGATLIAVSSIFNGIGRFLWGGISDRIGRRETFRIILGTQLLAFILLTYTDNPWLFALLVCYILLCYGGGFGTMPSFVLDLFGSKVMPAVYGTILTAWSAAGIAGPQLVALIKDRYPAGLYPGRASFYSFALACGFLLIGLIFSFLLKSRRQ
ncbi:membrane protein, major facilitator superfamily [Geotalea daltonii FRC-32]|uniref:Membrane protein, major facilitator superfamily n=1 Tax=Geotalea daltonii (strain DSM 22248 / JCM 15807 / FRC-32) TaxID=316067 RepID=B9M3A4_GEODF|nr:MFS transporter [Geotalea daltonii]ACM19514.1 membrane protein, major facilitator superfamily [Geotalea daltonii FRC-32]